ncbi:hypothetical protein V8F20_011597 [Naviculisporaceae sp. PSN 640]
MPDGTRISVEPEGGNAPSAATEDSLEKQKNLDQLIAKLAADEETDSLVQAALANLDLRDLLKHTVEMKRKRDDSPTNPLSYEHHFVNMRHYLDDDIGKVYSVLGTQARRLKVVQIATLIGNSFRDIADSIREGRQHKVLTFDIKLSALETMCKMFIHLREHRWNSQADLLPDIVTEGYMVGWQKYLVEVCKAFDEDELVKLADKPPSKDLELKDRPADSWFEQFSAMVFQVNCEIYDHEPEAAEEMEGAVTMLAGKPATGPYGVEEGEQIGPLQPHWVELHNPSGLSIVHKREC